MTRGRRVGVVGVAMLAWVVGCAAPEPGHGDLQKGAYRPPVRAPTFSPTEDAPHTFRPGQPPQVEPGPRPTRLLPQTPETRRGPGLWSATPPVATADNGSVPEIFDWNVPLPENDEPAAERIKQCAAIMNVASAKVLHKYSVEQFDKMNIRWRLCWPHASVDRCLAGMIQGARSDAERAALRRARDFADKAMDETCSGGGKWTPGVDEKLEEAWGSR